MTSDESGAADPRPLGRGRCRLVGADAMSSKGWLVFRIVCGINIALWIFATSVYLIRH